MVLEVCLYYRDEKFLNPPFKVLENTSSPPLLDPGLPSLMSWHIVPVARKKNRKQCDKRGPKQDTEHPEMTGECPAW